MLAQEVIDAHRDYWQNILHLQDWQIHCQSASQEELHNLIRVNHDTIFGLVTADPIRRVALIKLWDGLTIEKDDVHFTCLDEVMLHEMLHIIFYQIRGMVETISELLPDPITRFSVLRDYNVVEDMLINLVGRLIYEGQKGGVK